MRTARKRMTANAMREIGCCLKIWREHPKLIVLEDGLASTGLHIKLLQEQDMRYILGATPGDHKFLFEYV